MHRVYCDTGAFTPALGQLEREGKVELFQFMYENRSRRFRGKAAKPSALQYRDLANYTYDELGTDKVLATLTYDELGQTSTMYQEIQQIVGPENRTDVQHLDSAVLTGCSIFLTSDKADIWSKRVELQALLGLAIFHMPSEWEAFHSRVTSDA